MMGAGVRTGVLLAASLLLGCAAKLPEDHVMPVVRADRALGGRAAERGMKTALLEVLAADSTVFGPGPQPGRAYYQMQPDVGGKRTWKPSYAEVSSGGDFGYTFGPYSLAEAGGSLRFGHYVTVWRKRGADGWKLVIEGSSRHAPPLQVAEPLTYLPAPASKRRGPQAVAAAELRRIEAAQRVLASAWTSRGAAALLEYATDDLRYLPADAPPMQGRGAVQAGLGQRREELAFEAGGGEVAPAGDLGFTYGALRRKAGPEAPVEAGGYLRVWRRSARGAWQVALELHSLPPRRLVRGPGSQ